MTYDVGAAGTVAVALLAVAALILLVFSLAVLWMLRS